MLQTILQGNLGQDAEVISINEVEYTSFSVAVSQKTKGEKTTQWVKILHKSEHPLLSAFKKGVSVIVSGNLTAEAYTRKEDNKPMVSLTVWSYYIELLSHKENSTEN
ncbi:hypothetical protein FACS189451_04100 [Bacteroidia bacterium]|nr:hypothetical protein FACS189446_1900 [Bacteroidia bacterium]GHT61637.1 hypothetical protein FACS189451_04100 [Bacteroidia bacterium]